MTPPLLSLQFTLPETYGGFVETSGIAELDEQDLLLEFQFRDGLLGVLKSEIKTVAIPFSSLAAVRLHKGWSRTTLFIQVKPSLALRTIPMQAEGWLELRLARKDTAIAEAWLDFLNRQSGTVP
ncbi:MAG TPA: hypothetical protein V6C57_03740 [Coleofasciculaceae cyanobacterium]